MCLSESIFISFSFLKDSFIGLFSFSSLKIIPLFSVFHCFDLEVSCRSKCRYNSLTRTALTVYHQLGELKQ